MASRNKILKQADRLAQRGNHAEAARKLLKLVEESPRDVNLLNKAGDFFVRAGLVDDAVQQFDTIATFFKEDGFLLKAIAIYKKISKLDPSRIETFLQLGQLYAERGLRMEAKQNLQHAADAFGKRGDGESARKALELLEKLDPEDDAVKGKLVDLAEEGGDSGEAASRHLDIARKQLVDGNREEALAALGKAGDSATGDPKLLRGMADLLVEAGDPKQASELLNRALPGIEEPGLEYLLILGRAQREAGDPDGAKAHLEEALKLDYGNDRCHVEMALCYLATSESNRAFDQCRHVFNRPAESKSVELCRQFLDIFLDKEPLHPHGLRELALLEKDAGDEDAYHQVLSRLAGACHQAGLFREEMQILGLLAARATGDAATVLQNRHDAAEQAAAGQSGAIDETLIDFLPQEGEDARTADAAEVEAEFEPPPPIAANGSDRVVLGAEEDEAPAGESEIELIIEDDQLPAAEDVEEITIEEVSIDDVPSMADMVGTEPDPAGATAGQEPTVDIGAEPAVEPAAEPVTADEHEIKERITATRVFLSYGMLNKALNQMEELLQQFPDRADVCELAAAIYKAHDRGEEAEAMQAKLAQLAPESAAPQAEPEDQPTAASPSWMNGATVEASAEEAAAPAEEAPIQPTSPAEPEPPAEAETPVEKTPPAPVEDPGIDPMSEDLEEIDFFISQGFMAEARDLVQGLLKSNPGHPRLLEMLEQVGGADEEAPSPPAEETAAPKTPTPEPPPAPAAEPEPSPLADEHLSEVFSKFQEEVAGQVDDEDFGTHYDLGIAYKEMMLVDEAIGEFQIAARSSERRLDCCVMLGACFMEKGMPGEAIKWYEKGIATSETGSEESKGLQYDLAAALEADGAMDKALEVFQALAAMDGRYRDVAARIERLQSA